MRSLPPARWFRRRNEILDLMRSALVTPARVNLGQSEAWDTFLSRREGFGAGGVGAFLGV